MSDLNGYLKLKKQVESAQQQADKAEGALEQIMKRLNDEFDCDSLKDAEKKLASLQKQLADTKKEFEDALSDFEKGWEGKLE